MIQGFLDRVKEQVVLLSSAQKTQEEETMCWWVRWLQLILCHFRAWGWLDNFNKNALNFTHLCITVSALKAATFAYQCITSAIIELIFKEYSIIILFICLFIYSQIFSKINYVLDISLSLLISIIAAAGNVYKPLRLEPLCGPIISKYLGPASRWL